MGLGIESMMSTAIFAVRDKNRVALGVLAVMPPEYSSFR